LKINVLTKKNQINKKLAKNLIDIDYKLLFIFVKKNNNQKLNTIAKSPK